MKNNILISSSFCFLCIAVAVALVIVAVAVAAINKTSEHGDGAAKNPIPNSNSN